MGDCSVFFDVYRSLQGPLAGLTPTNCCQWDTRLVQCEQGRIVQISLMNMGLTGTISPRIGELKSLTSLSLKWNEIRGTIPNTMGDQVFSVLQLDYNRLTGTIPTNLRFSTPASFVSFRFNQLSGPIPTNFPLNTMFAGSQTTPICPFDERHCHDNPSSLQYCVGLNFPRCSAPVASPSTSTGTIPSPGPSPTTVKEGLLGRIEDEFPTATSTPTINSVSLSNSSFLEQNKLVLSIAGAGVACLVAIGLVIMFMLGKVESRNRSRAY
jgi:hypothetical protein